MTRQDNSAPNYNLSTTLISVVVIFARMAIQMLCWAYYYVIVIIIEMISIVMMTTAHASMMMTGDAAAVTNYYLSSSLYAISQVIAPKHYLYQ
jgi:hypothetical protein